jgi:hypothetical protein
VLVSGPAPEMSWVLQPWGRDRPFSGRSISVWFPVSSDRYLAGTELTLLRIGRWWGPARISAEAGLGYTCCRRDDKNAMFVLPTALGVEAFPIASRRFALGVGASYELRPSWFLNDNARGFDLIHGPAASIELAYVPPPLVGFIEGPRSGTLGVSFSVGRWLPDGGVTVFVVSLSMN